MSAPSELSQVVSMSLVGRPEVIPARLWYRGEDPFAVSVVFTVAGAQVVWTFARDLLRDGLHGPAGTGDVSVAPAGAGRVTLTLRSASGVAMVACDAADVATFVRRVYAEVPAGAESTHIAIDRFLADIA